MKAEDIFEVVEKLTGKVYPVGESNADQERLANLEKFIHVFREMHIVIDDLANRYKNSQYYSERLIGETAQRQINDMGI